MASANISGLVWGLVMFGIALGLGLMVLDKFQGTMTANTQAYNSTGSVITGLGGASDWVTILVVVGMAAAVFIYLKFFRQ